MAIKIDRILRKGMQNPGEFLQLIYNLPKIIKLYYRLLHDSRVPFRLKFVLGLAFAYVISPIDLIPDFIIPGLGQIDDVIILFAALKYFIRKCPSHIVEEHVRNIQEGK